MSEELLQRNLIKNPEKIGSWDFYNIGSTSINALKESNIIRSIDYGDIARKKVDGIIIKQKQTAERYSKIEEIKKILKVS